MTNTIDRTYYKKFRAHGYGARHAANLAIGWYALQTGQVLAAIDNDFSGCSCDYPAIGDCPQCNEAKHRKHNGYSDHGHKCACPYTFDVTVRSADREHVASLGSVCVNTSTDPYLDDVCAELAHELTLELAQAKARQAAELAPTPAGWMAL